VGEQPKEACEVRPGIYRRDLPRTDRRLGRHVHHDERSRQYAFDTSDIVITSVVHARAIGILDQGQVGSCTGNAGIGALATDPVFDPIKAETFYPMTESGALKLYSNAEDVDGDGPYPPNDNGSCGLSIAKCLQRANLISGYQHTFSREDALKALMTGPVLFGTNWYDRMFNPDPDGRVRIGGSLAGGHEIVAREIDAEKDRVWFDNSWGEGWGLKGRFYLTFDDFGTLLGQDGDIIVPVPVSAPAPVPSADPDQTLAFKTKAWAFGKHTWPATRTVAKALQDWYVAKGF
jgi:hypothetical protein